MLTEKEKIMIQKSPERAFTVKDGGIVSNLGIDVSRISNMYPVTESTNEYIVNVLKDIYSKPINPTDYSGSPIHALGGNGSVIGGMASSFNKGYLKSAGDSSDWTYPQIDFRIGTDVLKIVNINIEVISGQLRIYEIAGQTIEKTLAKGTHAIKVVTDNSVVKVQLHGTYSGCNLYEAIVTCDAYNVTDVLISADDMARIKDSNLGLQSSYFSVNELGFQDNFTTRTTTNNFTKYNDFTYPLSGNPSGLHSEMLGKYFPINHDISKHKENPVTGAKFDFIAPWFDVTLNDNTATDTVDYLTQIKELRAFACVGDDMVWSEIEPDRTSVLEGTVFNYQAFPIETTDPFLPEDMYLTGETTQIRVPYRRNFHGWNAGNRFRLPEGDIHGLMTVFQGKVINSVNGSDIELPAPHVLAKAGCDLWGDILSDNKSAVGWSECLNGRWFSLNGDWKSIPTITTINDIAVLDNLKEFVSSSDLTDLDLTVITNETTTAAGHDARAPSSFNYMDDGYSKTKVEQHSGYVSYVFVIDFKELNENKIIGHNEAANENNFFIIGRADNRLQVNVGGVQLFSPVESLLPNTKTIFSIEKRDNGRMHLYFNDEATSVYNVAASAGDGVIRDIAFGGYIDGNDLVSVKRDIAVHSFMVVDQLTDESRSKLFTSLRDKFDVLPPLVPGSSEFKPLEIVTRYNDTPVNDFEIREGTVLDFSNLVREEPIIPGNRVSIVGEKFYVNGNEFKLNIDQILNGGGYGEPLDGEDLARYVTQIKRLGFNTVRIHGKSFSLFPHAGDNTAIGSALTETQTREIDGFDGFLAKRDKWFKQISVLKENNIRVAIDVVGSHKPFYPADAPYDGIHDFEYRLFWGNSNALWDETDGDSARAHYINIVNLLINEVNPYTGKTLVEDEVLAYINEANELSLMQITEANSEWFNSSKTNDTYDSELYEDLIINKYSPWLLDKYGIDFEVDHAGVNLGTDSHTVEVGYLREFMVERQIDFHNFVVDYFRGIGYDGPLSGRNSAPNTDAPMTRFNQDFTIAHGYHQLDTAYRDNNNSSFNPRPDQPTKNYALRYIADMATEVVSGQPFVIQEMGINSLNTFRYEEGISVGAIAAMQGWSGMNTFNANAITNDYTWFSDDSKNGLFELSRHNDPITKATVVLKNLLWYRGDVSESNIVHSTMVETNRASEHYIFVGDTGNGYPYKYSGHLYGFWNIAAGMSLVTKTRQSFYDNGIKISDGDSDSDAHGDFYGWGTYRDKQLIADKISELNTFGILDNNETDGNEFYSTTGEIYINSDNELMTVDTHKTKAVACKRNTTLGVDGFEVELSNIEEIGYDGSNGLHSGIGACVFASSLTESDLKDSDNILIGFATDAQATNVPYIANIPSANAPNEVRLDENASNAWGIIPMRIKEAVCRVKLECSVPGLVLSAVKLNGLKERRIPILSYEDGVYIFDLGMVPYQKEPTVFYSLSLLD